MSLVSIFYKYLHVLILFCILIFNIFICMLNRILYFELTDGMNRNKQKTIFFVKISINVKLKF